MTEPYRKFFPCAGSLRGGAAVSGGPATACAILAGMKLASVILDIPTQALDAPYAYVVPDDAPDDGLAVEVGCAVLIPFGHRQAVGFVVRIEEHAGGALPDGLDPAKLKPIVRAYYFLVRGIRATGTENVASPGGYILCSNHVSASDPFVLATCVRRRLHFMAKAELFKNRVVGGFISAIGAFPIRRGESDLGAVRESIRLLNEGHVVGIFPQGTRSRDNAHTHMEPGVALIALRAGVKVVPAYIDGPYRLFRKTRVVFGAPVSLNDLGRRFDRATLDQATARLDKAIWDLKPAE